MNRARKFVGACLVTAMVGGAVGCSSDSAGAGAATPALNGAATLSDAFELESYPDRVSASVSNGRLTCGATQCLYLYAMSVDGRFGVYGVRTTLQGVELDWPHRQFYGTSLRGVVPIATGYFVSTNDFSLPGGGTANAYRVDAATGNATPTTMGGSLNSLARATGNTILHMSGNTAFVLNADTLAQVGDYTTFPFTPTATVVGPDQYLITDGTRFVRLNSITGTPLDASPQTFNLYHPAASVSGVYEQGAYVLAWTEDLAYPGPSRSSIFVSRIGADGSLMDPDDEFNQLSGAYTLCSLCSSNSGIAYDPGSVDVASVDGHPTVFWTHRPDSGSWRVYASRFAVASGTAVGGNTTAGEFNLGVASREVDIAVGGTSGMIMHGGTAVGLTVTPGASFAITRGTSAALPYTTTTTSSPSVAYNGEHFLVVWNDAGRIRGTRVNATTGAYVDDPPIQFGTGSMPVVASDGDSFVVAWMLDYYRIARRRLAADGTLDAVNSPHIEATYDLSGASVLNLRLIHNGRYYFVTWRDDSPGSARAVSSVRMNANGSAVDTSIVRQSIYSTSASAYTTVADSPANLATSTFLTVFNDGVDPLEIRRYRSELGSLIEPLTTLDSGGTERSRLPYGASDGTTVVVGWTETTSQRLGIVSALTGLRVGNTVNLGHPNDAVLGALWHDGRTFNALLSTPSPRQLRLQRFDSSLAPLEHDPGSGEEWPLREAIGCDRVGGWQFSPRTSRNESFAA